MAGDFRIQHLVLRFGASARTLDFTLGTDLDALGQSTFPLPAMASGFAFVPGFPIQGLSGRAVADNDTLGSNDVSCTVRMLSTTWLQIVRDDAAELVDCELYVAVVAYEGPSGGPNEFIIRKELLMRLNNGQATQGSNVLGVVDSDQVLLWPTSKKLSSVGSSHSRAGMEATYDTALDRLTVVRSNATDTVTFGVVAIELTGSNYSAVRQISHEFAADGVNETEPLIPPVDWDHTVMLPFFRPGDGQDGLDEIGLNVWPGSDGSSVRFRLHAGADDVVDPLFGTPNYFATIFLFENPAFQVEWLDSITGSLAPIGTNDQEETHAISDVGQVDSALLLPFSDCAGGGSAYPRANSQARPSGVDEVTWRRGRSGQDGDRSLGVVTLPPLSTASPVRIGFTFPIVTPVPTAQPSPLEIGISLPAPQLVPSANPAPLELGLTLPPVALVPQASPSALIAGFTFPLPQLVPAAAPTPLRVGLSHPVVELLPSALPTPLRLGLRFLPVVAGAASPAPSLCFAANLDPSLRLQSGLSPAPVLYSPLMRSVELRTKAPTTLHFEAQIDDSMTLTAQGS